MKACGRLHSASLSVVKVAAIIGVFATLVSCARPSRDLRVYVLDGGTLGTDSAVIAYLVSHTDGTLLWEAGTIPDSVIESRSPADELPEIVRKFEAKAERTLRSQLAEIGYMPETITHFAASHYHFDHIANAKDYASSMWLVQQGDRDAMFADGPPPFGAVPEFYSALEDAETVVLNGDHDVFGDGTVVLKSTPGHTPGHQVLFLDLANTGPVVLGGDIYHHPDEREQILETIPAFDSSKEQSMVTRPALEAFLVQTGADLWIGHDAVRFRSQKHSPEYYD